MAIGTPVNRGTAGGTTTATTASFTPGAGDTLLAFVFGRRSTVAPAQPTISDSLGGTWTEIADVTYDTGANPRLRARLFRSVASGSAMTVTGAISDGTTTGIMVVSVSGVGTDFSNFGSNTNAAGDPSITLTAPGATSAVVGFTAQNATNLVTQVASYTELTEFTANAAMRGEACYDISSPASTVSWTSTNTLSIGIAVELKEPAGGGTTFDVNLSSSASGTASAGKSAGKVIASSASGSSAVTRSIAKGLVSAASGALSVARSVAKGIASTVAGTSAAQVSRAFLVSLSSTVAASSSITKAIARSLASSIVGSAALTRAISKSFSATAVASSLASSALEQVGFIARYIVTFFLPSTLAITAKVRGGETINAVVTGRTTLVAVVESARSIIATVPSTVTLVAVVEAE